MNSFTLEETQLEEFVKNEVGSGEYEHFTFYTNTDIGNFDAEKGAMTDYQIIAFNNITNESFIGYGGYHNINGHHFFESVTFELQEKNDDESLLISMYRLLRAIYLRSQTNGLVEIDSDERDKINKLLIKVRKKTLKTI